MKNGGIVGKPKRNCTVGDIYEQTTNERNKNKCIQYLRAADINECVI